MKILFLTAGTKVIASSRTRVFQYLPYLRKKDIECHIIAVEAEKYCQARLKLAKINFLSKIIGKFYSWWQILCFTLRAAKYDVLFIQRVSLSILLQKLIKKINANIIFDFDDALYLNKNNSYIARFNNLLKESKYVIIENKFTRNYALEFNKNIFTIIGPIEVNHYLPRINNDFRSKIVIGWIGSPATAVFIRPLYEVFKVLTKMHSNLVIHFIGGSELRIDGINLVVKDWHPDTEVLDLQDFDIGIMPLPDDEWSRGKGGYKLLQYMSLAIPCVASPVGINTEIIKEGINGFLAVNEAEWLNKLSLLINDGELRGKLGRQGREIAKMNYSYEASFPKFISVIEKVML